MFGFRRSGHIIPLVRSVLGRGIQGLSFYAYILKKLCELKVVNLFFSGRVKIHVFLLDKINKAKTRDFLK